MDALVKPEVKDFLLEKALQYNTTSFISSDPISIPHQFSKLQDIEIAGLLSATIAWGNRKMIIRNAQQMMLLMDNSPYEFVMQHSINDLKPLLKFKHRTFNGNDLCFFIKSLKNVYNKHITLESLFVPHKDEPNLKQAIIRFRNTFLETEHEERINKHIANPDRGSACKRLIMFLRWMVRQDKTGVDFGIWHSIPPALLSCPLDVHSGKVARKLGLLQRKQNDWKAVEELDLSLREISPKDPALLDFALFGLGVFEGF